MSDVIRHYEGIDLKEVYRKKPLVYKAVKRLFDIAASALVLIVLSPLFLILAILIKIEDGGPVLKRDALREEFEILPDA